LVGREAVDLLKEIARNPPNEDLATAAHANLDYLERIDPKPRRSFLEHAPIPSFKVGDPFTLRLRFRSSADVREARLVLQSPAGVELIPARAEVWRGPLVADQTQEIPVTLRVPEGPTQATVLARLKLDFDESLDVEVLTRDISIHAREREGRVPPEAAPRTPAEETLVEVSDP
jgi:hypothetical protein